MVVWVDRCAAPTWSHPGFYKIMILPMQTAQMMRQATHCFEPQRKAFGRQYVMPLYLVYFSCACHPSDFTKHTPPFGECDFPKPGYTSCFVHRGSRLSIFRIDHFIRSIVITWSTTQFQESVAAPTHVVISAIFTCPMVLGDDHSSIHQEPLGHSKTL